MRKEISEIKAKKSFAGPGTYGYDAEAVIYDADGKALYVHLNDYEGMSAYTVSEDSVMAFMCGDGKPVERHLEEYETLKDAEKSEYVKVFKTLRSVVKQLRDGV